MPKEKEVFAVDRASVSRPATTFGDEGSPKGLVIPRHFTSPGADPYREVAWELRTASITNEHGETVFEQTQVEVPSFWSQTATNVVASKYFRGQLGSDQREHSVKQLVGRVANTITEWGMKDGYFASGEEVENFRAELTYLLLTQRASFNSPVWFNVGIEPRPQCSACQPYHAMINTVHGFMPIGKIVDENLVGLPVYDGEGLTQVVAVKRNGRKPVFRITLNDGFSVEATPDHLVCAHSARRTRHLEWKRVDELKPGMVMRIYPHAAETVTAPAPKLAVAEAALAGWLQADGFVGQYREGTNRSLTVEFMTVDDQERQSLELSGKACPDIRYSEIVSIEPLGETEVYDIQTLSGKYLTDSVLVHNCFILSVDDTMESILEWYKVEGMIFKYGSGSGVNLSPIRSSEERLAGGGTASGPVSFMKAADASAGVIKSGGKCFKQGTLVATPEGWRPIESLQIGDSVLTHRGPRPIADFMPNGLKPCYRVRTREGYEVEVTEGHKFAYWNAGDGRFETRPIESFLPGESLYLLLQDIEGGSPIPLHIPRAIDLPQATTIEEMVFPGELNDEFAYVLGLMYGDGELRTSSPYRVRVCFGKNPTDQEALARFRVYGERLFGEAPILLGDETGHQQWGYTRKRLIEFLVANGLAKGKAHLLQFPRVLFKARPEVRAAFIAGIIDSDGTYQARGGWSISSVDRAFLVELQRLLLTLGIPSKIKLNRKRQGTWKDLYRLSVVGYTFIDRLVQCLTPYSAKVRLDFKPSDGADRGWGYRPTLFAPLSTRVERRGGYQRLERTVASTNETTGYGALVKLAEHPDVAIAQYAQELSQCVQVTLESVESTEIAPTYDIEVQDVHLLSANGFYASNTRRAAKMVVLNADHPDIERFIRCKWQEEEKAWTLVDSGYDSSLDGEAYSSVFFQNANNSVRATDAFMEAALQDRPWDLKAVTTGEVMQTVRARELLRLIAEATWHCGDPGMQFDTTVNRWHTCPNSGRINASNPCSEYMSLDDSACNLASLNLMKFLDEKDRFLIADFRAAVRTLTIAMDIIVDNSSYPTPKIAQTAKDYRQLGLGYANLGALLMSLSLPYDSDGGRAYAATVTALLCGESYRTSTEIAGVKGPYAGFAKNREPQLAVIRMHRDALIQVDDRLVPEELFAAAAHVWEEALRLGQSVGVRNSQVVVLAPTGTIGFMLDCDTTGVEPDIALIKYKKLVGGGLIKIVNQTLPRALKKLGYAEPQIKAICDHLNEHETIEGASGLDPKHLSVFDCAFKAAKGTRSIHYMGHVRMMGAVQPFISGAISKTVNVPPEVTVDEIVETYLQAWKAGVKAIAIYRDGSKRVQPLSTGKAEAKAEASSEVDQDRTAPKGKPKAKRRYLPDERQAITHKFSIAGHDGYLTVGLYDDGKPGEIFIVMSKEGTVISGLLDAFATAISLALQYGVPLEALVKKFSHMRFEPAGVTSNPQIRFAQSILDYVFRWLALKFLPAGAQPEPPATVTDLAAKQADVTMPSATVGTTSALTPTRQAFQGQVDAPPCPDCGAMMVRSGSCYKCMNCGATSGCS